MDKSGGEWGGWEMMSLILNMLCLRSQVDMPCRQLDPGIFQFSKEGLGLEL